MNDILSELDTLKADYAAAQTLLAEAQTAKATLDAQLSDKDSSLAAKDQEISTQADRIAALNADVQERDAKIATLTAAIESLKQAQISAEKKAVEMVAAQGVRPVKVDKASDIKPATRAEVLGQWQTLTSAQDRAAFYREHKALINGK
jgi:chromosome segregation ATPase